MHGPINLRSRWYSTTVLVFWSTRLVNRSFIFPYTFFKQLTIVVFALVSEVLHITSYAKKSDSFKLGDRGSEANGPSLPIYPPGITWKLVPYDVAVVRRRSVLLQEFQVENGKAHKMFRYDALITVGSDKKGLITLSCIKPHHTLTWALSLTIPHVVCECLFPPKLQMCLFKLQWHK